MRTFLSFTVGVLLGVAIGILFGLVTADENNPRQRALREAVATIRQEARQAARAQRTQLEAEYTRLVGRA